MSSRALRAINHTPKNQRALARVVKICASALTKPSAVVDLLWRGRGGAETASPSRHEYQVAYPVSRVSASMQRVALSAVLTIFAFTSATAGPLSLNAPERPAEAAPVRPVNNLGGGFLEQLFGGFQSTAPRYEPNPFVMPWQDRRAPDETMDPARPAVNPHFMKQVVGYDGNERPGTVIINTNERMLYLVRDDGSAIRYGIGVG